MFITKKHLDRRTFLRGAMGTAIALPFLDAMVPAATAQTRTAAAEKLRFGAIYMPNGIYPGLWHPEKPGKGWAFNRTMKPMEPYRQYLTTVSQMKAPEGKKDMGGIHMGASAAFLNGSGPETHNGEFNLIRSKKSVDQYIADAIAGDTPLHSLEVGTEDMGTSAGACDGYPCVFFNTMAWRDDKSPLPVSVNPQVTFERMFGEPGSSHQRIARLQTKESMLDSVLQETGRLQKKIGASDNAILDEYLTSVRRVEEQLKKMQSRSEAISSATGAPIGIPEDYDEHMTVTYDLLHLAFQGDLTRVFSLMVGHEASGRSYAFLGVKEPHHSTSHHKNTPESLEAYAKIGAYHMVKLGEFVEKLKNTREGDHTLLDSSLVYFGAGMSNGLLHDRHNVPALMVGTAGGRIKAGGEHIVAEKDQPTSNLLLAMADKFGVELDTIGIATGRMQI
ncbi:MAG: DUF1552 domain-containing protein [Gammaproteobacteria bacterium]